MIHLWEKKLNNYFNTNLILDREADEIRKQLLSQVSLQKLFEAIDLDTNGFLTISEFAKAIIKSNKSFHWDSLRRMMKQYDKKGEFSLSSGDFSKFFQFNGQAEEVKTEQSNRDVNETSFTLFIDLVLKEIEITNTLSAMADDIKTTKEFITYEAFRSIAGFDKYITEANLNAYLTSKGIEVKDKSELSKIIYRYDKNMDGCFSYNEFKDIFSPYSSDNTYAMYSPPKEKKTMIRSSSVLAITPQLQKNTMLKSSNTFSNSNVNTNFMSKKSKIDGLAYDYSFDEMMPNDNDNNNDNDDIQMPIANNTSSTTPFKRTINKGIINSALPLSNKPKCDYSPLELKAEYSNYENPPSNSMLNNSFINMSISQKTNQAYPNLIKRIKENQLLSQSYLQQSPYLDNRSLNSKDHYNLKVNRINDCLNYKSFINENKQYLIQYLNEIVINESICETIKEEMFKWHHFNIHEVFEFFDHFHRLKISLSDLKESLKKISIIITNKELKLLFNRYDYDNDSHLNFNDFSQMILPKKRKQDITIGNKLAKRNNKELPSTIISSLSNLFYSIISCVKACDFKMKEIASNEKFSNVECYDLLKSKESNTVYKEDLINFYLDNQIQVSQLEIDLLMDYFDKDKDGQIFFNEFARECSFIDIEDMQ